MGPQLCRMNSSPSRTEQQRPLLAWVEANKVTRLAPVSELPPTEWLIRHIHARKYVGLTAGAGGLAKTQLMLTEIVSIATGVDLLEHGGVRKAKVLLLNKEESRVDIQKRLRAVVMHHRGKLGLWLEQATSFDPSRCHPGAELRTRTRQSNRPRASKASTSAATWSSWQGATCRSDSAASSAAVDAQRRGAARHRGPGSALRCGHAGASTRWSCSTT